MQHRIVYTRFDGGANVCCPADEIKAVMTNGGGWFDLDPRGVSKSIKREIEKQINNGRNEYVTKRFVHALAFGGCTDAEFFEIIRDRDCAPYGTGMELWDFQDVPADRWFRNAWRRSANGGPIDIDLEKARPIQAAHIQKAVSKANARPQGFVARFLSLSKPLIVPDWDAIELRIRDASDERELRVVWPRELRETLELSNSVN